MTTAQESESVRLREQLARAEEKLLEQGQALAAAQAEAQTASKAKSEFLATMSHELRTPLNSVLGFAQVLLQQYFGPLNDRQRRYVEDILDAGRNLQHLIDTILDLAKVDSGRSPVELSDIELRPAVESSIITVRERCLKHSIEIDVALSAEAEVLRFRADERKFRQILYCLLSNAAKFTPDGGKVSVGARVDESYVEISIQDTGAGIQPGETDAIFREFYQILREDGMRPEGTGLGLPLALKLARMHGGTIRAFSEGAGRGSMFIVRLPLSPQVSAPVTPSTASDWFSDTSSLAVTLQKVINFSRRHDRPFSVCRFAPVSGSGHVDMAAVAAEAARFTRNYDIWFADNLLQCVYLLLLGTGKSGSNVVCGRMVESVKNHISVDLAYTIVSFPSDGQTAEALSGAFQKAARNE